MRLFLNSAPIPAAPIVLPNDSGFPPPKYEQVNTIEDWANDGIEAVSMKCPGFRDRKVLRSILKGIGYDKMVITEPDDLDNQVNWDKLNRGEKSIMAHYFLVVNETFQLEVVNDSDYWLLQASEYRRWSTEVRQSRLSLIEAIVFLRMAVLSEAKMVLADLNQVTVGNEIALDANSKTTKKVIVTKMNQAYVDGIEGMDDDGITGLKDYIDSTDVFNGAGFRDLTYTFKGSHTAATVADELLAVMSGMW